MQTALLTGQAVSFNGRTWQSHDLGDLADFLSASQIRTHGMSPRTRVVGLRQRRMTTPSRRSRRSSIGSRSRSSPDGRSRGNARASRPRSSPATTKPRAGAGGRKAGGSPAPTRMPRARPRSGRRATSPAISCGTTRMRSRRSRRSSITSSDGASWARPARARRPRSRGPRRPGGMRGPTTTACDADGRLDFAGIQKQALRTVVESGEVLVRRRIRRPEDGLPIPLQLQVLEPDHLDATRDGITTPNGGRDRAGDRVFADRATRRLLALPHASRRRPEA